MSNSKIQSKINHQLQFEFDSFTVKNNVRETRIISLQDYKNDKKVKDFSKSVILHTKSF